MEENNSDKALREKATERIAAAEPETPRGAADGPEKPVPDAVVRPHGPATPRFRFPSVGDLLALLGVFVVCQLVAWVVALLCGMRMPDAGGAPLTPEQQQQTGVFVAVNYAVSMTLMILATLLYRRLLTERSWERAVGYAIVANVCSATVGLLLIDPLWRFIVSIS